VTEVRKGKLDVLRFVAQNTKVGLLHAERIAAAHDVFDLKIRAAAFSTASILPKAVIDSAKARPSSSTAPYQTCRDHLRVRPGRCSAPTVFLHQCIPEACVRRSSPPAPLRCSPFCRCATPSLDNALDSIASKLCWKRHAGKKKAKEKRWRSLRQLRHPSPPCAAIVFMRQCRRRSDAAHCRHSGLGLTSILRAHHNHTSAPNLHSSPPTPPASC